MLLPLAFNSTNKKSIFGGRGFFPTNANAGYELIRKGKLGFKLPQSKRVTSRTVLFFYT